MCVSHTQTRSTLKPETSLFSLTLSLTLEILHAFVDLDRRPKGHPVPPPQEGGHLLEPLLRLVLRDRIRR